MQSAAELLDRCRKTGILLENQEDVGKMSLRPKRGMHSCKVQGQEIKTMH